MLTTIPAIFIAILPKYIIDNVVNNMFDNARIFVLIFVIILGVVGFFRDLVQEVSLNFLLKLFEILNIEVAEKKMTIDYQWIEDNSFLNLASEAEQTIATLCFAGIDIVIPCISNMIKVITFVYILSKVHIFVSILTLVSFVLVMMIKYNYNEKIYTIKKKLVPYRRKNNYIFENVTNHRNGKELRIFNLKKVFLERFDENNNIILSEIKNQEKKKAQMKIEVDLLDTIQLMVIYIYLVGLFYSNALSIGDFTVFITVFTLLISTLLETVNVLNQGVNVDRYISIFKKYMAFTDEDTSSFNSDIKNIESIQFVDVWFKYPKSDIYALKNINVDIKIGKKTLIIGENGAGKTTFIKLLIGLYRPTKGKILVNGINALEYDQRQYKKLIATLFQDFQLFDYSMRENLFFNSQPASDSIISQAFKRCGMSIEKDKVPEFLDSYIGKGFVQGSKDYSGGEKQKIAYIRTELKKSELNILDEPSAALDVHADVQLQNNISTQMKNKTVIFISHKMSTVSICDYVIAFENGEVIENDRTSNLVDEDGLFNKLFTIQEGYYNTAL